LLKRVRPSSVYSEKTPVFKEQSLTQKVIDLTNIVIEAIKENPLLIVLMIGAAITRLVGVLGHIYLLLWI
jgi:hypothetical protein